MKNSIASATNTVEKRDLFAPVDPNWSYSEIRDRENRLLELRGEHGDRPEIARQLAVLCGARSAYREATAYLYEALQARPEMDRPRLGFRGRMLAISYMLHGAIYEPIEALLSEIASNLDRIKPVWAAWAFSHSVGYGLHDVYRPILVRFNEVFLRSGNHRGRMAAVLLDDFDESASLAKAVKLISLGQGCYPWLQLNRMMLRVPSQDLQCMPLNLAASLPGIAAKMMKNEFAGIDDPSCYDICPSKRSVPIPRLRSYQVIHNHEADDFYLTNDFANLRSLNRKRADNFLAKGLSGPRVYVQLSNSLCDYAALEDAIVERAEDLHFRLLLIDTRQEPPTWQPRHAATRIKHIALPDVGYSWITQSGTPEGIDFDLRVRHAVREAMAEVASL